MVNMIRGHSGSRLDPPKSIVVPPLPPTGFSPVRRGSAMGTESSETISCSEPTCPASRRARGDLECTRSPHLPRKQQGQDDNTDNIAPPTWVYHEKSGHYDDESFCRIQSPSPKPLHAHDKGIHAD